MMRVRTNEEVQEEHNAAQVALADMALDESLDPPVRAAILYGAASVLARPSLHALDLSDLRLRTR